MTTTTTAPRAWVGCLACYNEGRLVGEWVDASEAGEYVPCERADHEEWWVMDHEGLPISGECSPATAQAWGELLDTVDESQRGAFLAWVEHGNYSEDVDGLPILSDFEEAYAGEWDSERDYAEDLAEQCGYVPSDNDLAVNPMLRYIDWEAWTRDLFLGDYYSMPAPVSGVYVFRSY